MNLGNEFLLALNGQVMALHAAIGQAKDAGKLAGVAETVPTMRSLMVTYDPLSTTRPVFAARKSRPLALRLKAPKTRQVTIPCCYDGDDLCASPTQASGQKHKETPEQVIEASSSSTFKVCVLGFMPAWLTSRASIRPYLLRRSQPRVRLPRSTVAIAMDMTTIYLLKPGGWHPLHGTPPGDEHKRKPQLVFGAGRPVTFQRIDRKGLRPFGPTKPTR